MTNQHDERVRAEHERDKAEQLLHRAELSTDPAEAERLRYRAEQMKEHSEAALRREVERKKGDAPGEYLR
jgi:hypothetical protein